MTGSIAVYAHSREGLPSTVKMMIVVLVGVSVAAMTTFSAGCVERVQA